MRSKCLIILLLTSLTGNRMLAQSDQYNFTRLDITQGLSHNRINCIFKDSQGFMWFGTMSGLNRYDGYTFKVFRHDLQDSTSISDNDIISIAEDSKGRLWIVNGLGFNIYNPTTESFYRDLTPILQEYSVPDASISNIYKDSKGNLWFINNQTGLYRYEPNTRRGTQFIKRASDSTSLSSNDISAISEDLNGNMWIVNHEDILEKMDVKTGKIIDRYYLPQVKSNNARQNYDLYVDLDGDVWVYFTLDQQGIFILILHPDQSGTCTKTLENIV